jgi:hypothetical protein
LMRPDTVVFISGQTYRTTCRGSEITTKIRNLMGCSTGDKPLGVVQGEKRIKRKAVLSGHKVVRTGARAQVVQRAR